MNKNILITTSSFGKADSLPNGFLCILNPFKRTLQESELQSLLQEHKPAYLIAGTEKISKETLQMAKSFLKGISRCGVGMDNVDLQAAKELGIPVWNTPDAPTKAVAELTIGLMLDVLRRVSATDRNIRNGKFDKFMGSLLSEKTIGIIGYGRIGRQVAHYVEAFGCKAIYNDLCNTVSMALDCLFKESDIITLHCPLTPKTKYIINAEALAKMKKTAILLNVSRGGLVEENALLAALSENRIAGAALDCFEKEPYNGELAKFDNVVLTSHIGSYAKESRIKQELDAVKNILENEK